MAGEEWSSEPLARPTARRGERKACTVVHVEDPGKFFVRLADREDEAACLDQAMGTTLRLRPSVNTDMLREQTPVAVCSHEGGWRRGIVETVEPAGRVSVLLVDHGRRQFVARDRMCPLPQQFCTVPPFAYECALYNMKLYRMWRADETLLFRQLCGVDGRSARLTVVFVEPGRVNQVQLVDEMGSDIAELLVGAAVVRGSPQHERPTADVVRSAEAPRVGQRRAPTGLPPSVCAATAQRFARTALAPGTVFERIAVVTTDGPEDVYLQAENQREQLQRVTDRSFELYEASSSPPPPLGRAASVGAACVALFAVDGHFYRGEVVGVDWRSERVRVHFVDFGNSEWCGAADVRSLPDDAVLLHTPVLALRCAVAHLVAVRDEQGRWPEQARAAFESLANESSCEVMGKSGGRWLVELRLGNGTRVAESLIASGWARSGSCEGGEATAEQRAESQLCLSGLPPLPIPAVLGDYLDVLVSFLEDEGRIFVQLKNELDAINNLSVQMSMAYSSLVDESHRLINPKRGELCAAKYPLDGQWYRGCVVERPSPRQVRVFFVDYGNTEELAIADIKALFEQFLQTPPHAVQLSLAGAAGATRFDKLQLRRLLENKLVSVKLEGDNGSRAFSVRMHYFDDGGQEFVINEVVAGRQLPPSPAARSAAGHDDAPSAVARAAEMDMNGHVSAPTSASKLPGASAFPDHSSLFAKKPNVMVQESSDCYVRNGASANVEVEAAASKRQPRGFARADIGALVGTWKTVYRSAGDDPSHFYVQLDDWSELYGLLSVRPGVRPLAAPTDGCAAVAQFRRDWFRCEVRGADAFFVDYGNAEPKGRGELFEVDADQPEPVRSAHAIAVACRLEGVAPSVGQAWTLDARRFFADALPQLDVAAQARFVAFDGATAAVRIVVGEQDVGEAMVSRGFARQS